MLPAPPIDPLGLTRQSIREAIDPIDDISRAASSELNKLHSAPPAERQLIQHYLVDELTSRCSDMRAVSRDCRHDQAQVGRRISSRPLWRVLSVSSRPATGHRADKQVSIRRRPGSQRISDKHSAGAVRTARRARTCLHSIQHSRPSAIIALSLSKLTSSERRGRFECGRLPPGSDRDGQRARQLPN